jgi:hypothetical protein
VKLTVVPSGTGVPAEVITSAEMAEVPAFTIVCGFAMTVTLATVTGFKNKLTMLKAPLAACAVMFRTS